jgi:hypothetical protein
MLKCLKNVCIIKSLNASQENSRRRFWTRKESTKTRKIFGKMRSMIRGVHQKLKEKWSKYRFFIEF